MASGKIKGISLEIGGDTNGLSKALNKVRGEISDVQKELKAVDRLLKLDPGNTELLAQKQTLLSKQIGITQEKLQALKTAKDKADSDMKNGTEVNEKQYRELQREIIASEQALDALSKAADNSSQSFDNMHTEASEAVTSVQAVGSSGNRLEKLGSVAGGVAKGAAVAAGAVAAVGGALVAAAEGTREYREDLNKLDAAFISSGHGAESGRQAYSDFYAILGESDRSVEAASHLAQLTNSQEELAQWSDICAGVTATFGDSLPIEGLTEAANETAKVGQVTGPLADALNWAGISEDQFNKKLKECNTEKERSTLITETLNSTYANAAATYKELNADIISNRQATEQWNMAMAGIGAAVDPIIGSIKALGAEALTAVSDGLNLIMQGDLEGGVAVVTEGINSLVSSVTEMLPQLLEMAIPILQGLAESIITNLPVLINAAIGIVTELGNYIIQNIGMILETAMEIMSQLADALITALPELIPAVVDIILQIVDTLINNLDRIIDAAIEIIIALTEGIIEALPRLVERIPEIIVKIYLALVNAAPKLLDAGMQLISMLWNGITSAVSSFFAGLGTVINTYIIQPFKDRVNSLLQVGRDLITGLWNGIQEKVGWLKEKVLGVISTIKGWFTGTKGFDERSPSKWSEKVFEYLMEGGKIGIEKNKNKITDEIQNLIDNVKLKYELGIFTEEEYYNSIADIRDNYLEKGSSAWWDYTKELVKYEKTIAENTKKEMQSAFQAVTDEAEKSMNDIESKQKSFLSKIRGNMAMYETRTVEIGEKSVSADVLTDWRDKAEAAQEYVGAITSLQNRIQSLFSVDEQGQLTEFMEMIRTEDSAEGRKITEMLMGLTDTELSEYVSGWKEYLNITESMAGDTYEAEAESIKTGFIDKVLSMIQTLPEAFRTEGEKAADFFGEALTEKMQGILAGLNDMLASTLLNMDMSSLATGAVGIQRYYTTNQTRTSNVTINSYVETSGTSPYQVSQANKAMINGLQKEGRL